MPGPRITHILFDVDYTACGVYGRKLRLGTGKLGVMTPGNHLYLIAGKQESATCRRCLKRLQGSQSLPQDCTQNKAPP